MKEATAVLSNSIPSNDEGSTKSSLSTRIVSGTIGSIITSLVVTPLEVVKVRTQAAGGAGLVSHVAAGVESPPQESVGKNGAIDGIKAAANSRGSQSLRGASLNTTNPINVVASSVPTMTGAPARSCGMFVLFNGHADCMVAKSTVPFFDATTGVVKPPAEHNLGTFGMLRRIFRTEGLAGIYSGLRPTLVMAAPNTVMYYTAYEEIVWRLRHYSWSEASSPFVSHLGGWLFPLLAGGSARLVSSTATAPLEFLRTRQAAAIGRQIPARDTVYSATSSGNDGMLGLWNELRAIVRNEGISTLYRGLRPTLWRDVPFSAIYWLFLEQFRLVWKAALPSLSSRPLSSLEHTGQAFINGAIAGMIAATCTTPFDLAKTRQQTFIAAPSLASGIGAGSSAPSDAIATKQLSTPWTGTFHQLRLIAQTDGIAGLWRGNQARVLKVAPACAIMLSSYELGKRILE